MRRRYEMINAMLINMSNLADHYTNDPEKGFMQLFQDRIEGIRHAAEEVLADSNCLGSDSN